MSVIRTLLVEDEQDIQFIVKLSLERGGQFDITTFDTGVEALEYLEHTDDRFDLAVVNFRLPSMNGLDFIRRMKAIAPFADLPAIIISAAIFDRDLAPYEDVGVLGVISKPFVVRDLPERVLDLYRKRAR